MVFTKSLVRTFIRRLAWRAFTWAENLNDTRMEQNGEDLFLAHLPEAEPFVFFDVGANTLLPGAKEVLTVFETYKPFSTAFLAKSPAAIRT